MVIDGRKKHIEAEIPSDFPVIALSNNESDSVQIIDYHDIFSKNYVKSGSDQYSYFIPKQKEETIKTELSQKNFKVGEFHDFQVIKRSNNKQYIKLRINTRIPNSAETIYIGSWYEVIDNKIIPKYYVNMDFDLAGGFLLMLYTFFAFPAFIILLYLVAYYIRLVRLHKSLKHGFIQFVKSYRVSILFIIMILLFFISIKIK